MLYTAPSSLLNNQVILVTGAGNGIGAAVAKSYAKHGATVILLDKNIADLEKVYDDIVAGNLPLPAIYPLDLKGANTSDYETLVATIDANFSRLDGLVHCAATLGQIAPLEHQDPKTWAESLHVNLTAPYLLTRACLTLMKKQTNSSIIFSTDASKDKAYWSGYGIAKAGIESLCMQLANELENEGRVRVNCIDPGQVKTDLLSQAFPAIDPTSLATPDDVTPAYLYLMGNDSVKNNGKIIKA